MWLILFASTCSVADRETKYNTEATVPQVNVLLVRDHLPTALTLAKERYSDAYLLGILVHVELPQVNSGGDEISFEFRSPSNKKMSLIVFCQKACHIEETTTTLELPQCPSLEINNSLIESDEALELGLKNGGADYLSRENAYLFLTLERNYPRCDGSTITWRVQFGDLVTRERISFTFDAVSRELLETR